LAGGISIVAKNVGWPMVAKLGMLQHNTMHGIKRHKTADRGENFASSPL
jgi:hypothetical protein